MEEKDIMQLVGSVEAKSTHPIGKAFYLLCFFLSDIIGILFLIAEKLS